MEQNECYTVEFLPEALGDMTEIVSAFVMLGSKQGARRIRTKMLKAAEQVGTFPYSGVTVPDEKLARSGFRMMVAEKYLMLYRIFEDEKKVIFYRVLNGTLNYPSLMGRLAEDKK